MKIHQTAVIASLAAALSLGVAPGIAAAQCSQDTKV